MGNVIGTNVTIVTAALGLSALLFPMVIDRNVRRQTVIATLVSILPIVLLFLGIVTQLKLSPGHFFGKQISLEKARRAKKYPQK